MPAKVATFLRLPQCVKRQQDCLSAPAFWTLTSVVKVVSVATNAMETDAGLGTWRTPCHR